MASRIGKTAPKGDALPLGTKKSKSTSKKSKKNAASTEEFLLGSVSTDVVVDDVEKILDVPEKIVAPEVAAEVSSVDITEAVNNVIVNNNSTTQEQKHMESITLVRKQTDGKRSSSIPFTIEGRRGSVRFSKTLFAVVPEKFEISLDGLAEVKQRETKEQRKARLALRPKKTKAEKIAAMEQKLAKAKAALEAEQAAPATTPETVNA